LEPQVGTPPEVPKDLDDLDLRFSANAQVPDWAKGKSPGDLVDLVEQLRTSVVTSANTPDPVQASPQVTPPPLAISTDVYSDTEGFVKSIQDYTQASVFIYRSSKDDIVNKRFLIHPFHLKEAFF